MSETSAVRMWLQQRLALNAMSYVVPIVANRLPYFLGGLTLCGLLSQVASGIYLAQYYNPDPSASHRSVVYIVEDAWMGDFARSLHAWSADLVLATVGLHLLWVFWRGSYKSPREVTYWAGVVMLGILFLLYFTGTVLKNDQEAVEALVHNVVAANLVGFVGRVLTPGFTPSAPLLTRLYGWHVSVLPLLLVFLVALHLWLIRHLDIHTYPNEQNGGSRFQTHARKLAGLGLLTFALTGLIAIFLPAPLGLEGITGMEMTKPPFFFLWIYALENLLGARALAIGPTVIYLLFFLPPLLDRKASVQPKDRMLILAVGFGLMLLLIGLGLYAKLAPAQQHLDM